MQVPQGMMRHVPDPLQRALGLAGVIVTLPLVAVLAAALKVDSRGPALYRATRVGEAGRLFTCYKLRTMRLGAEASNTSGVTFDKDPRVTRLGRFLRRFRLDELTQLWNVARGEMRLVGPRPEAPQFVDLADPVHQVVFTVRPGITGLAQLLFADEASLIGHAEPETDYRERILPRKLRYDLAYLQHRSFGLDLWILGQTPRALFGRGVPIPSALRADIEG